MDTSTADDADDGLERTKAALDVVAAEYSQSDLEPMTPEEVKHIEPVLVVPGETYQRYRDGTSRLDIPEESDERVESITRQTGILVDLLTPRSRARIIEVWLRIGERPVTISEVADEHEQLTRQTVHEHRDALLEEYQLIVEAGMEGNAMTYRLNYRNPLVQCLQMLLDLGVHGRAFCYLERQFLNPARDAEPVPPLEIGE